MRISLYTGDHYTVIRDAGAREIARLISSILVNVQASQQPRSWKSIFVSSEAKLLGSAPRIRMPHNLNDFRISLGTSKSLEDDSAKCTQDAYGEFVARSGCMPKLILVTASPNVDPEVVVATLQQMAPEARVQAVSSVSSALCNNGSAKLALLGEVMTALVSCSSHHPAHPWQYCDACPFCLLSRHWRFAWKLWFGICSRSKCRCRRGSGGRAGGRAERTYRWHAPR